MCEVIEGTSPARLAEVLGLDASRFAGQRSSRDYAREDDMGFVPRSLLPDEERFRGAEPLAVRCQRCGHTGVFPGALAPVPGGPPVPGAPAVRSGLFCTSPSGKCKGLWGAPPEGAEGGGGGGAPADASAELAVCAARLHNALSLALRRSLCALQAGWLVCEDALCGTRTRCQSSRKAGYACTRPGCNSVLRPEREAGAAHNQLDYLRAVFDNEHARRSKEKAGVALPARPLYDKASGKVTIERAELPLGHYAVMDALCAQARDVLGHSAYHHVPLGGLFAYVGKMNERARVTVKPLSFPGAPAGGDEGAAAARAAAATAAAASGSTLGALGPAYSVAHGGGRGAPAKARRVGAAEGEGRPATDGFMALTEE
jgi:DNA polymerase alpha subunit A